MTSSLNTLRSLYLSAIDGLVARYPRQEANRAHYRAWAEGARLGRITRPIRTKGALSVYETGALVLFSSDREEGTVAVWGRTDGDSLTTLVGADAVEPVCSTCEGSGRVAHRAGLVTFGCPSC